MKVNIDLCGGEDICVLSRYSLERHSIKKGYITYTLYSDNYWAEKDFKEPCELSIREIINILSKDIDKKISREQLEWKRDRLAKRLQKDESYNLKSSMRFE